MHATNSYEGYPKGVNMLKRTTCYKVQIISKDDIGHMAFLCWSISLIFAFFIPNLELCFEYNYYLLYLGLYHLHIVHPHPK
jgi:hypothetical protein